MEVLSIALAFSVLCICISFGNCDSMNHTESFERYKICMTTVKDVEKCKDAGK